MQIFLLLFYLFVSFFLFYFVSQIKTTIKMDENLLTIDQVLNVIPNINSKQTIYDLVHKKKIPHIKIGKRLFFEKDKIEKWISEQTIKF